MSLLASVVAVGSLALSPQAASPLSPRQTARDVPSFARYMELVNHYRKGELPWTIMELSRWAEEDVEVLHKQLLVPPISADDIGVASLLHTEVAIFNQNRGNSPSRIFHLKVALELSPFIEDEMFRRELLLAVGYLSQVYFDEEIAVAALEMLLEDSRQDSEALLALGTVYEAIGLYEKGVPTRAIVRTDNLRQRFQMSGRFNLGRAEDFYRRALDVDEELVEARLRLGRVLQLTEKEDEAAAQFEWVIGKASTPYVVCMAHLFSGRLHEKRDEMDEALRHYRLAADAQPGWQVVHLALSHALRRSGDQAGSGEAMERALGLLVDPFDPDAGRVRYHLKVYEVGESILRLRRRVVQ